MSGIVVLALGVSLVIGVAFWRQAPGVTLAIVGGVIGAIAGFVGWVFVPTNLHHVDMLDGGIAWSFGGGLPAATRGFAIGVVAFGALSLGVARPPAATRASLRRAAIWLLLAGLVMSLWLRTVLHEACRTKVTTDPCSGIATITATALIVSVALAVLLIVLSSSAFSPAATRTERSPAV